MARKGAGNGGHVRQTEASPEGTGICSLSLMSVILELVSFNWVRVDGLASCRCDKQSIRVFDAFAVSTPVSSTGRKPPPEQLKDIRITLFKGTLNFKSAYKLKLGLLIRLNRSIVDSVGCRGGTGKSQLTLMD